MNVPVRHSYSITARRSQIEHIFYYIHVLVFLKYYTLVYTLLPACYDSVSAGAVPLGLAEQVYQGQYG